MSYSSPEAKICSTCWTLAEPRRELNGSGTFHLPFGPVARMTASAATVPTVCSALFCTYRTLYWPPQSVL
eukprot:6191237-Pleurochrysis_carterae.AAC.1